MATTFQLHGDLLIITVRGRFEYHEHATFRDAYESAPDGVRSYRVDLDAVEHIDSAALGMLILLRRHAESRGGSVSLAGARPQVRRVLDVARFERLFTILPAAIPDLTRR